MNDEEARWHGWEIAPLHAGLARRYRDPMFDTLIQCPDCLGKGSSTCDGLVRVPCHVCTGTGRLRLQGPGASYGGELAMGRPRDPNDPSVWASVETALSDGPHTGILGVLWHWRYELMITLGLPAGAVAIALTRGTGWLIAAAVATAAAAAGLCLWPSGRDFLRSRAWCVITAHRVRAGCMNAWVQSRNGKLPVVLRTTAKPFGERVRLWCPPGVSAEDLEASRDILAAACWARDVQVARSVRYAHIVTLDVIRRDLASPAELGAGYPYVDGWERPTIDESTETGSQPDEHDPHLHEPAYY
jgi:hypothetical protein